VANWLAFTAVVGLLTLSLLVLARQSQQLFDDQSAEPQSMTASAGDQESTRPPSIGDEGSTAPDLGVGGVGSQHDVGGADSQHDASSVDGQSSAGTTEGRKSAESDDSDGNEVDDRADAPGTTPPSNPGVELTPAMLLVNVAATQGLVAAIVVAAGWYYEIPVTAFGVTGDPWNTGLPAVAVGVGFGLALWVGNELATTVADAAGAAYDESVRELLAPDSGEGWLVLFGVVLPIIALGEELLFRAALIGVPAAGFDLSSWLLAVVASVAFALGHGAQGRVGIVVTGLLGLVLAAGYVLSGSLLLVVVAHYVVNATEFAVYEYAGLDGLFARLSADSQ